MVLDRRNIFSIFLTSFNILIILCSVFTFFCKTECKNVSLAFCFATSNSLDNHFSSAT